jgi:hypothetical protein
MGEIDGREGVLPVHHSQVRIDMAEALGAGYSEPYHEQADQ